MNFIKSINAFGKDCKEIPCITGAGVPTATTAGGIGSFYMNTTNGDIYKCINVSNDNYTWELINSGNSSYSINITSNGGFEAINGGEGNTLPGEDHANVQANTANSFAFGDGCVAGQRGFTIDISSGDNEIIFGASYSSGSYEIQLTQDLATMDELAKITSIPSKASYSTYTYGQGLTNALTVTGIDATNCKIMATLDTSVYTGNKLLNYDNLKGYVTNDPTSRYACSIWFPTLPAIGIKDITMRAFSINRDNKALGDNSVAMGRGNTVISDYSTVVGGKGNYIEDGNSNFAGGNNVTIKKSTASFGFGHDVNINEAKYSAAFNSAKINKVFHAFAANLGKVEVSDENRAPTYATAFNNGTANGNAFYSLVHGYETVASSPFQRVGGRWNIIDNNSKYLEIVGNGSTEDSRSNAYTLDIYGNAEFSGNIKAKNIYSNNSEVLTRENYKTLPIVMAKTLINLPHTKYDYSIINCHELGIYSDNVDKCFDDLGITDKYVVFILYPDAIEFILGNMDLFEHIIKNPLYKGLDCVLNIEFPTKYTNKYYKLTFNLNPNTITGKPGGYTINSSNITIKGKINESDEYSVIEFDTFKEDYIKNRYSIYTDRYGLKLKNTDDNENNSAYLSFSFDYKAGDLIYKYGAPYLIDNTKYISENDLTSYFENNNGESSNRPATPYVGQQFFDTTLGKPIWYNGTNWVSSLGTEV